MPTVQEPVDRSASRLDGPGIGGLVRILHVIGWLAPRYGGTSEVVRQYQRSLTARGHEVDIVTTNVDGGGVLDVETGHAVEFRGAVATFHSVNRPRRFLTSWSLLADLRRRLDTYDLVHVHSLYRFHTIAAAVVARHRHVPYVLQAHGSLNPPTRARRRRLKDVYHRLVEDPNIRNASLFLCTSTDEEAAVREHRYGIPTAVVPLGVDAAALREPIGTDHGLEHLGVSRGQRLVTFLGRISREKGVELVFEAFELVAARLPDVQLVLAGPDDQGIASSLLASGRGGPLSGRITTTGTIDHMEKRALLQGSSVFVLPSTGESFGLAVAEAMAVGCPVVVSPQVSLQNTIRASGAGLVVRRDAGEIAVAIESILMDPERAAVMGEAGRRVVDTAFSWSVAAADLERIYDGIVSGVRGRLDPKEEPGR